MTITIPHVAKRQAFNYSTRQFTCFGHVFVLSVGKIEENLNERTQERIGAYLACNSELDHTIHVKFHLSFVRESIPRKDDSDEANPFTTQWAAFEEAFDVTYLADRATNAGFGFSRSLAECEQNGYYSAQNDAISVHVNVLEATDALELDSVRFV